MARGSCWRASAAPGSGRWGGGGGVRGPRGAGFGSLAEEVRRVAVQQGLVEPVPDGVGERGVVRPADLARPRTLAGEDEHGNEAGHRGPALARLCKLAEEFDDGTKTVQQWVEWLRARFDHGAQGGVHLLTLHRAKGLEFDAGFLPRGEGEGVARQAG